ncbi:MAG: sel1 repeat family protein [Thermoguttaceae bacterium]|nr:sel1 repeat family protein [Thermoguttaceae bacterium]
MNDLATRYLGGAGVPRDFEEAVRWFQRAAEAGNVEAMCNLGNRYYKGTGIPLDLSKAVYWYRCAAETGGLLR